MGTRILSDTVTVLTRRRERERERETERQREREREAMNLVELVTVSLSDPEMKKVSDRANIKIFALLKGNVFGCGSLCHSTQCTENLKEKENKKEQDRSKSFGGSPTVLCRDVGVSTTECHRVPPHAPTPSKSPRTTSPVVKRKTNQTRNREKPV